MTELQKETIAMLRQNGSAYKEIAEQLDLSVNTVKSYCQRHDLQALVNTRKKIRLCLQCHTEIPQKPHRKAKKFCCDKCRQLWWAEHSSLIHRNSQIELVCLICGKKFLAYPSKHRKYCSRLCYGKSKGVSDENRDVQQADPLSDCHDVGAFIARKVDHHQK